MTARTKNPVPHEDITYTVIGCAMRAHNTLGPGLKEAMYQRALSRGLDLAGLSYETEWPIEISVDGTSIGLLYLDHVVEDCIVVEEKALSHLVTQEEIAQVTTYLCATGYGVGLLLNFGRSRPQYKRIFPPKDVTRWRERIRRYVWNPRPNPSVNPLRHPLTDASR